MSIHKLSTKAFSLGAIAVFVSAGAIAEVKSLSSSELTETYIQDSTIIITPKQLEQTRQSTVSALTIAPVEGTDQDLIELQNYQNHVEGIDVSFALDDESLRNASVDLAINPLPTIDIASFQELNTIPVADILNDERFRVPEGDFNFDYVGNDLGLSRNGNQLTFSIGNLPGINPIDIPEGINEGPVQLVPRDGGGFDLTINIPEPLQNQ